MEAQVQTQLRSLRRQRRAVRRALRELHLQGDAEYLQSQQGGIDGRLGAARWAIFSAKYQAAVVEMARVISEMQFWQSQQQ